jgi:hypothetical protein
LFSAFFEPTEPNFQVMRTTAKSDIAILNFALTLESLEAAFYAEAVSKGRFGGKTGAFATVVSPVGTMKRRIFDALTRLAALLAVPDPSGLEIRSGDGGVG